MKKEWLFKPLILSFFLFFSLAPLYTQSLAGKHTGEMTAIIHNGDQVISAGEDGFIVIWDLNRQAAIDRFQLTTYKIEMLISNPIKNEICIIEAVNANNHRISVWDYTQKVRIFTIHSNSPIYYINYSGNGSLLLVSGFNGSSFSIHSSVTGELLNTSDITGNIALAVTGKAETNMLLYQSGLEGQILYMDLNTYTITETFQAPSGLYNTIIFGNNRFIAGVNSSGLHIVDASSGALLDRVANIERNALLYPFNDVFYCLTKGNRTSTLHRFSIGRNGKLSRRQEAEITFDNQTRVNAIAFNKNIVFASTSGELLSLDRQNRLIKMSNNSQIRLIETSVGSSSIAVLTEDGGLFFLPLDYRLLTGNEILEIADKSGYTKITPVFIENTEHFILWQTSNNMRAPLLLSKNKERDEQVLNHLIGRLPIRSISYLNNNILVLDSAGNIQVRKMENVSSRADFTFSSVGAIDAAFINNDYLALCRSTINNNSSFLFVNYKTSETVPYFYPAQTGLAIYPVSNTNAYAEAIVLEDNRIKTVIIDISNARNAQAARDHNRIFEYDGETFLMASFSQRQLAVACGNEGIFLLSNRRRDVFQRTSGLPVKLQGNERFFISLDSEGNIAWHNNTTGDLLAVFSLYKETWVLNSGTVITGRLSQLQN